MRQKKLNFGEIWKLCKIEPLKSNYGGDNVEKDIINIAKRIQENGGCLYLVGGAVRDEILGIKNHDEDYCVEGL